MLCYAMFLCSGLIMARSEEQELDVRKTFTSSLCVCVCVCVCVWLIVEQKHTFVLSVLVALHHYTLCDFANAHACCFTLLRLRVIKQWSAYGGTCTSGDTRIYLALTISFHYWIGNTYIPWWKLLEYIDPLKTKSRPLYLKTYFVPRSKHFSSRS